MYIEAISTIVTMILRERPRADFWSGSKKMANKNKAEKEREKAEWQLALDLQEKKLLEGIKEACNSISDSLKDFLHPELKEIKTEINVFQQDLQEIKQTVKNMKFKNTETNKKIEKLKEQNKSMQASIMTLECKALENFLRLEGSDRGEAGEYW